MINWPHAPPHRLSEQGAYMVTGGTCQKVHLLDRPSRMDLFRDLLFDGMMDAGWQLHAWAILSNHYHFVASSSAEPGTLKRVLEKLHSLSARAFNMQDRLPGRKVWFQYFDTHITFPNSYLPRLKYVHHNPAHHGVVRDAVEYPWCSAGWFRKSASPSFRRTVESFKTDTLSVYDGFDAIGVATKECESGVKPPHSTLGGSGPGPSHT